MESTARALCLAVSVVTLSGLYGCAGPTIWRKAGATQQDYNVDSYGCERDARQSGYFGGGLAGALNMRDFFNRCMVAHGWTPQQASYSNPAPSAGARMSMCKLASGYKWMLDKDCANLGGSPE